MEKKEEYQSNMEIELVELFFILYRNQTGKKRKLMRLEKKKKTVRERKGTEAKKRLI